MSPRVLLCCGSGGVGKTTLSAALAVRLARDGARVAVLTIDPARRLADSLGIGALSNTPRRVPLQEVDPAARGSLDALMLDARSTFDGLVRRFSPDPAAAEQVLRNRYYQFAAERLGGSHEYMAMERLLDLVREGDYDVIVVDTPPTRHALDFLKAPERMAQLMDQGVLRWLVLPASQGGWRALEVGSEAVARVLKRLLGQGTVGEIAEFFEAFRGLGERMRDHSLQVQALLAAPSTRFYLVSSPAPAARGEALFFLDVLQEQRLPFGGFFVNRAAPAPVHPLGPADLPAEPPPDSGLTGAEWAAQRAAVLAEHARRTALAAEHARAAEALRAQGPAGAPCWIVPDQGPDLHELPALVRLSRALPALLDR